MSAKATSTLCYEEHQGNTDRKHKRGSVPSVKMYASTQDYNKTMFKKRRCIVLWHNLLFIYKLLHV